MNKFKRLITLGLVSLLVSSGFAQNANSNNTQYQLDELMAAYKILIQKAQSLGKEVSTLSSRCSLDSDAVGVQIAGVGGNMITKATGFNIQAPTYNCQQLKIKQQSLTDTNKQLMKVALMIEQVRKQELAQTTQPR